MSAPSNSCKGLTFLPIPEFTTLDAAFGADGYCFFDRHDLPDVPREHVEAAMLLFYQGGKIPDFQPDVDRSKAAVAIRAWLCSFAPSHESKQATAGYAFWLWSTPIAERAEAA